MNNNFNLNDKYGDAIKETSKNGYDYLGWYDAQSWYVFVTDPFFHRGGSYAEKASNNMGYDNANGKGHYWSGFRCVLI